MKKLMATVALAASIVPSLHAQSTNGAGGNGLEKIDGRQSILFAQHCSIEYIRARTEDSSIHLVEVRKESLNEYTANYEYYLAAQNPDVEYPQSKLFGKLRLSYSDNPVMIGEYMPTGASNPNISCELIKFDSFYRY